VERGALTELLGRSGGADTTLAARRSVWAQWCYWCMARGLEPNRAGAADREGVVAASFVLWLATRPKAVYGDAVRSWAAMLPANAEKYVQHVKTHLLHANLAEWSPPMAVVGATVRALTRQQVRRVGSVHKPPKAPLTRALLRVVSQAAQLQACAAAVMAGATARPTQAAALALVAAAAVVHCWWTASRMGDTLERTQASFNQPTRPNQADVQWYDGDQPLVNPTPAAIVARWARISISFMFRITKADPSGKHYQGTKMFMPRLDAEPGLCPVRAHLVLLWLNADQPCAPLFRVPGRGVLTRAQCVAHAITPLQAGVTGHSCRLGAANCMLEAGLSMPEVMCLCRWQSPASFRRYLQGSRALQLGLLRGYMAGGVGANEATVHVEALRLWKEGAT